MTSYVFYKEKLVGEYLRAFDRAEIYAMGIDMADPEGNDMLMELIDILYTAQQEGKPVEKVLGPDIEKFCREFFEGYNTWNNFLHNLPRWMYRMAWIVFFVTLLDLLAAEQPLKNFFAVETDISYGGAGVMVGILTVAFTSLLGSFLPLRWKRLNSTVFSVVIFAISLVFVLATVFFMGDREVSIPLYTALFPTLVYILLYKSRQFFVRYKKYGSIRKPQEEKEIGVWHIFRQSMRNEMERKPLSLDLLLQYEKRFTRKNRRRMRRNRSLITEEEFTETVRQENGKYYHHKLFYPFLFGGICLVPLIVELIQGTTWYDFLIYAVILFVIEAPMAWFFMKTDRMGCRERDTLLQQCAEQGITLPELARRIHGEETEP